MKVFNYELKLRIKDIRLKKNISQKELANKTNIKTANLCNYENNKELIPITKLLAISDFLQVSMDYLVGLDNQNNYFYNNINSEDIGKRLKEIRLENKLYQETFAKSIGTSKSLICEYEKGKKLISLPYAYAICKKYNVSMDYLYGKTKK